MKKLNKVFNCSALAVAAMTLWAGSAQATSINFLNTAGGLYSTGVNNSGTMLTDNASETHYTVRASTGTGTAGTNADATSAYNFGGSYSSGLQSVTSLNLGSTNATQTTGWAGYNTTGSSAVGSGTGASVNLTASSVANASTWISLNDSATGTAGTSQFYTYRTSFNLSGMDLSSVIISGLWASDNRGKAIYLNGTLITTADLYGTGVATSANYGTTALAAFSINGFNSLLVNGDNYLDFEIRNDFQAATGLRVQFDTAQGNAIPEPESIVMLIMGLGGMLAARRRKA